LVTTETFQDLFGVTNAFSETPYATVWNPHPYSAY